MDLVSALRGNLLSPAVLAFGLGAVATFIRSDLRLPRPISAGLSVYLLLAIGLKGGHALGKASPGDLWLPALATLVLGAATPVWCYAILRRAGRFGVADGAALAAHYGSVSAVTFFAAIAFLDARGCAYEGFMPTLVALLEVPAIVVALLIARRQMGGSVGQALHEVFAGKSVVLLIGGLLIGAAAPAAGYRQIEPFFVAPFMGVLTLFLLDMGMAAARRSQDLRRAGPFLVGFGLLMPVLHGSLGVALGTAAGLSLGGATVLGVLAASASYIAPPAAVRVALPQANPSYYLTASLAITFPFNITLGIPLMYEIAKLLQPG